MDSPIHLSFKASDRSYLAILKKDIHALAIKAGFNETKLGETDIIVAEMAGNLVKHAAEGIILARRIEQEGLKGLEIISIDKGPGIADIGRMMTDGMSTKNTLGHGLGAIKRLSDFFQVYSQKEWGTIMIARIFEEKPPQYRKPSTIQVGTVILPKPGETECGDAFFWKKQDESIQFFLGDGLGHGHDAAEAAKVAGDAFLICPDDDPPSIIRYISQSVRKTRGLVGTVVAFNKDERKWRICGVGNIMTKIMGGNNSKTHISYNGIIGLNLPNTLNSLEIEYEKEQVLLMCSDGIRSRWDLGKQPGILRYDLSILASSIFKDYSRHTDDSSVAACKINV